MSRRVFEPRILVCAFALLGSAAVAADKLALRPLPVDVATGPSWLTLTAGAEGGSTPLAWLDPATRPTGPALDHDPAPPNDPIAAASPVWAAPSTQAARPGTMSAATEAYTGTKPSPATLLFGALLVGAWTFRQLIQRSAPRAKPRSLRA